MSKDYLKTLAVILLFATITLGIIFFKEIRTAVSGMMMGQAGALVKQLIR